MALLFALSWTIWASTASAQALISVAERSRSAVVHLSVYDGAGHESTSGSGFFVSPDGRLVTNQHVIADAFRVVARLEGGRELEIEGVLAADAERDLAILKAPGGGHPHLELGVLRDVRAGQPVAVIGSPAGFSGSLSTGIVSAVREQGLDAGALGGVHSARSWQLQITAPISPGSSGSPILSEQGKVIGVAVGVVELGQALNFGVSADSARELLDEIAPGAEPKSFADLQRGEVQQNLLISALGLGAAALIGFAIYRLGRRGGGKKSGVSGLVKR